ncbi:Rieske 2Fe-2S domain-containing protein [Kordiimonas sp. SCSIO 12610]|uniref:Rieske (2Fe-2S) protein n=1 Tax=Kordiimonas sp. SCSIO 12610 TaxID=2829597 RepID=UPI002108D977|nr:Rieske 2Fe-2S domain-containing protein [Kordiimonas sp. SCSIO 12610]UTW54109.1 Rieske 2Fe-2S domain-containing protein [Kordiimonas sp. SCSIO 12610]
MNSTNALINVGALPDLDQKGRALVKLSGKQIAIFKDADNQLYAINNRCPHEGYPLIEGTITEATDDGDAPKACKLACNWHGWSFDLSDGEALKGRDNVRTYPIEKRGSDYFLDLSDIDPAVRTEQAYNEFDEAISEHDYDRIARSLCRLEQAGAKLENSVKRVLRWSADRFERGIGHPHAGLVDWITLSKEFKGNRTLAFLEAIGHFSWDGMMGANFPFASGYKEWSADEFVDAIEEVDEDTAIKLARDGLKKGLKFANFKPLFQKVIFNHYMGFGHPAIYLMKIEILVNHLGDDTLETLVFQMTRYLTNAAREDLIPEFRMFGGCLKRFTTNQQQEFPALPDSDAQSADLPRSGDSVRAVLEKTAAYKGDNHRLWEHLLRESAINMLRFDVGLQDKIEQPIARNIGWLDFTHAITFAEAVKFHSNDNTATTIRFMKSGLLQMACFVGRNARYLGDNEFETHQISDHNQYIQDQKAALFNMDEGEYIYAVHRLKMICAVEKLSGMVSVETVSLLVAALNKYLSSRIRMRHPARALYQARETVMREG